MPYLTSEIPALGLERIHYAAVSLINAQRDQFNAELMLEPRQTKTTQPALRQVLSQSCKRPRRTLHFRQT